jgi:alpha-beta hydrolase superfamily lysophospholipase
MSLIAAAGGEPAQGYQAIPLPRAPGDDAGLIATMVRRSCGRPSRRAVLYVHCLADSYVQADLAAWYLAHGFHFYVADLRAARPRYRDATLAEYFGYLDSAARQVRDLDGNKTVLVSAHQAGAVIAALWCHARRHESLAEALIMADPDFGPELHWLYRLLGIRQPAQPGTGTRAQRATATGAQPGLATAARPAGGALPGYGAEARTPEVLPRAQRKLRRGLDISCPVLVMSPSAVNAAVPGAAYRAAPPARLGPHVTSVRLASAAPGLARPDQAARKRLYDELSRWLGAYLSGQFRDQLL